MSASFRNRVGSRIQRNSQGKNTPHRLKAHDTGFVLVQVMVAIAVVAFGLSGLLTTQREGLRLAIHGTSITAQVSASRDIIELFHLHRSDLPEAGFTYTASDDDIPTHSGSLEQSVQRRLNSLSSILPEINLTGQCSSASGVNILCTFCLQPLQLPRRDGESPVCAGPVLI